MSNEVEMMNVDQREMRKPSSNLPPIQKGILDGKVAENNGDFQEDIKISPEEQLRLMKEIRMENFPDEILLAMKKAVDFELKYYPSVRYSDAELALVKNTVMEKIDDILKRLAC